MTRALVIVACLAGCASRTPSPMLGARPPAGCEASIAAADARCMGWYLDRVLVEIAVTEVPDPALHDYVASVGDRVARAGGWTAPLQFRVIDDLDSQAESFIGGAIYVHRGALLRLRSEAELAALLGHEIGHIIGGHPELENKPMGVRRDDEIQADELAVRLTAAAGYDPRAVETMLRAIAADDPAACGADVFDPSPVHARLDCARAGTRAGRTRGELGVAQFRAGTATVVLGDDPMRVAATPSAPLSCSVTPA